MKTKNILICVTGLTPQIVTETLYCLSVQRKIKIDEIYILTTQKGRDVILGIDNEKWTPKTPLKNEIIKMCDRFKIQIPKFDNNDTHIIVAKEESIELSDIRTDKANQLFPNKVCQFLREITKDENNVLFCSISGGRKTMSVHLATALSIFGREKDKLLHVLTSSENEFKGFYPINKKEDKELELAEIPYIRLRSLLSAEIKNKSILKMNYDEIVKYTQKQLKYITSENKLVIDTKNRTLSYGTNVRQMEAMLFVLYYCFVDMRLNGKEPISIYNFISEENQENLIKLFEDKFNDLYKNKKENFNNLFDKNYIRAKISKINNFISNLIQDDDISSLYKISVIKQRPDSKYFIPADNSKIEIL